MGKLLNFNIMIEIRIPKRGDYCIKKIEDKSVHYIDIDSISSISDIDNGYELVGVVCGYINGEVLVVRNPVILYYNWCDILQYVLTGYTLDGTDQSGVLSIRDNDSATANTDYTIPYNATTKEGLVEQLNAFFANNEAFKTQGFYASIDNDKVIVHYHFTFINQIYIAGKNGFTLTKNTMPDVIESNNFRRKNGNQIEEGVISNMERVLEYFRNDSSSLLYNPTYVIKSVKLSNPVCLPAYLGTSSYRDGDKCEFLRSVYGEGEEGWKKFIKSFLPVYPTDYGIINTTGKELTKVLASKRYNDLDKVNEPMCKAAYYCHSMTSATIDEGEFWLPGVQELSIILDGIKYGTINNRNADILNKALYKVGWVNISNKSNFWSAHRYATSTSSTSWFCFNIGLYTYGNFFNKYNCLAVSLYPLTLK